MSTQGASPLIPITQHMFAVCIFFDLELDYCES